MTGPIDLTDAEKDALATLARSRRLMVILVPDDATDAFLARLTIWQNFCLDTRLLPPLWIPASRAAHGDGLVCPFCGTAASAKIGLHDPGCDWRRGAERYGAGMLQVDAEFGEGRLVTLQTLAAFFFPLLAGAALGFAFSYRRAAYKAIAAARTALDLLAAMEEAQDPGREVHERLARAFEAELITSAVNADGGPPRPDPAARRAAAMALAARMIDVTRRAGLMLVAAETPGEGERP